ncbi:reverse transcriptase domain, reverse transcriptase zinc-binding domain protein [Tanacetum coccineum]
MNEDTPIGVESAIKEGVTPSVVDMTAEMENKASGKRVNFRTLFTPGGNGIDVVVPVESIRAISEQFANTSYVFFLGKQVAYPVVANYVRNTWGKYGLVRLMFNSSTGLFSFQFSSMDGLDAMFENGPWSIYTRAMIELRADVELKDNIVVAMPKITREGHYTCNIHVVYERKSPRCASCKVFGHIHEECLKNTVGFKPTKEYRPVPKKHTANSSGIKKKDADPTNTVSDSNPFEVLNSVNNDVEMGTNGGTSNLDKNGANSSESSFWNVKNSSTIIDGKAILVDEASNPLKKVECLCDHDSEDEVSSVDNDMARDLASERTGFGTQSLLEQWRDSYGNGDYDDDPYDDDIYEGHDLSEEI